MHLLCHAQAATSEPVYSASRYMKAATDYNSLPALQIVSPVQPIHAASLAFCQQALPTLMTHSVALP